jgi:antirestriction protein ArdC
MATSKQDTKEPKKPFSDQVAEKLIKQLEAGTAPWQRPWGETSNAQLPMNPSSGNRYKGINVVHLLSEGRADPRWMTYKQAETVGAQVRKGEKGTTIQFWSFPDRGNADLLFLLFDIRQSSTPNKLTDCPPCHQEKKRPGNQSNVLKTC